MPRSFPSGRYGHTNPLRRLFGLQLLAERLPDTVGTALFRAWMQPGRFPLEPAVPSVERLRLPAEVLALLPPRRLNWIAQLELLVARRIVELPRTAIEREARNRLLREQGAYLRHVYAALARQLGEATALAEFERLIWSAS